MKTISSKDFLKRNKELEQKYGLENDFVIIGIDDWEIAKSEHEDNLFRKIEIGIPNIAGGFYIAGNKLVSKNGTFEYELPMPEYEWHIVGGGCRGKMHFKILIDKP